MDQLEEEDGTSASFSSTFMDALSIEDDLIGLDIFDQYDYSAFDGISDLDDLNAPDDIVIESEYSFENFMQEHKALLEKYSLTQAWNQTLINLIDEDTKKSESSESVILDNLALSFYPVSEVFGYDVSQNFTSENITYITSLISIWAEFTDKSCDQQLCESIFCPEQEVITEYENTYVVYDCDGSYEWVSEDEYYEDFDDDYYNNMNYDSYDYYYYDY